MFIFLPSSETRTRGYMLIFFLPSCKFNVKKFSFSQRVVSEWNSLPPKAVNQTTVNDFRNIIDSIFRKRRGLHIGQNRPSAPVLKTPSVFFTGGIQWVVFIFIYQLHLSMISWSQGHALQYGAIDWRLSWIISTMLGLPHEGCLFRSEFCE